ncbi:hypothetical protein O0L34_g12270 [Tuta absoluta]|nr:hypothetical protein O0L34_g12270 [Tuta absoluta]
MLRSYSSDDIIKEINRFQIVELPPLETRQWIPPWMRRRKPRPKLPKMLPPPTTELPACVGSTLKKVWHAFEQVDTNKMMLRGTNGCNSKRYSSTTCGAQTGCIAFIARALLDEKTPAQLLKKDVDDVIEAGDQLYRQCIKSMKCYKGKPALELKQILPQFYFHDWKYSVVLNEEEKGILAKHPDNLEAGPDMLG